MDKLSKSIQVQLGEDISKAQFVSLALDQYIDITGCAQLSIFIQYVFESSFMKEELLDLMSLSRTTTRQDTSNVLITEYYRILQRHNVTIKKISSITTDGAPSMFGKNKGAILH